MSAVESTGDMSILARRSRASETERATNSGRVNKIVDCGKPKIEGFRLKSSSVALRTRIVSAITAEQDAHMHLISLALEPAEKAAHAVPAIVVVIIVIDTVAALLAVD